MLLTGDGESSGIQTPRLKISLDNKIGGLNVHSYFNLDN